MEKIIKTEVIYNKVLEKEGLEGELFRIKEVLWRYSARGEIRVIIERSYSEEEENGRR